MTPPQTQPASPEARPPAQGEPVNPPSEVEQPAFAGHTKPDVNHEQLQQLQPEQSRSQRAAHAQKRPADDDVEHEDSRRKKRRSDGPAGQRISDDRSDDALDPVQFWAEEGRWPDAYAHPVMDDLRPRQRLFRRKRSNSRTSPSELSAAALKNAPYCDSRYEIVLATCDSFMTEASQGVTAESAALCTALLSTAQPLPAHPLFADAAFERLCEKVDKRNEARVVQDLTRLLVPSAETLETCGAAHLRMLVESVNEPWSYAIPLTAIRPQPDYAVGFQREAFNEEQLQRLAPIFGDILASEQSIFLATHYMCFPFLTCEVKSGMSPLVVADRQNAHSATLAVRAVTKLFITVERGQEVDRQILAFSISHDDRNVRIYGYYPVMEDQKVKLYRHLVRCFDFRDPDGRDKWTSYQFTKNLYEIWMPMHWKRICSAVDDLPLNYTFDAASHSTGRDAEHSNVDDGAQAVESASAHASSAKRVKTTPATLVDDTGKEKLSGEAAT